MMMQNEINERVTAMAVTYIGAGYMLSPGTMAGKSVLELTKGNEIIRLVKEAGSTNDCSHGDFFTYEEYILQKAETVSITRSPATRDFKTVESHRIYRLDPNREARKVFGTFEEATEAHTKRRARRAEKEKENEPVLLTGKTLAKAKEICGRRWGRKRMPNDISIRKERGFTVLDCRSLGKTVYLK